MRVSMRTLVPVLALVAVMAACDDEDEIGPNLLTGRVRFVNLVPDATGNLLLTANNVAVGSSLGFGSSALTCSNVSSGVSVPLATGTANAAGNGISSTLATSNANVVANGNFSVLAVGPAANTQLVFLNNATTAPTGSNAALRFVNAASGIPGGGAVDVFIVPTATSPLTTPVATNINFANSSSFITVPAQTGFLVFTRAGTTTPVFTSPTSTTLTAGQIANIALAPTTTGFQTVVFGNC